MCAAKKIRARLADPFYSEGRACVKGTRTKVGGVLDNLAAELGVPGWKLTGRERTVTSLIPREAPCRAFFAAIPTAAFRLKPRFRKMTEIRSPKATANPRQ